MQKLSTVVSVGVLLLCPIGVEARLKQASTMMKSRLPLPPYSKAEKLIWLMYW